MAFKKQNKTAAVMQPETQPSVDDAKKSLP